VKECKLGSPDQSIHKYATNDTISMTAERKTKSRIHIIDLEAGKPSVHEALAHLDFQLANAQAARPQSSKADPWVWFDRSRR